MKTLQQALLLVLFLFCEQSTNAQTDSALDRRLDEYVSLTRSLEFEQIMNYIYPKLFTIAPREQLADYMRASFQGNDEIEMQLDSMKTGTISQPISYQQGLYRKVNYSMILKMRVKDENPVKKADTSLLRLFQAQYGKENIRYDEVTGFYTIRIQTSMIAIKDETSPEWTFLNFKPEDALVVRLLPKQVIEQLKQL
jgi:hypothetical protein